MKTIILIGSGGFLGTIARYGLQRFMGKLLPSHFPFGTLLVNLIGCFAIGLVYGLADRSGWMTEEWKLFLAVGICGGFTTFSSFSHENIRLLQTGHPLQALIYICISLVAGLMLTYLGIICIPKA